MKLFFVRLPILFILFFILIGHAKAEKPIVSRSDMESLSDHVAMDAKEFLGVIDEEGRIYREDLATWIIGIKNLSKKWRFGRDEIEEKDRLHELSVTLGRALGDSTPGRPRSDRLSVYVPRPNERTFQKLSTMLVQPKQWLDAATRDSNRIGWVLYGYMVDVPGKQKPYVILKMTHVKNRLFVWGGCFSMDPKEPSHQRVIYPECWKKIAKELTVPSWAKPPESAIMVCSYWFQQSKSNRQSEEDIFADLLILEFVRSRNLRLRSRWIDPMLLKPYSKTSLGSLKKGMDEPPGGINYETLSELYKKREWQQPECYITGVVELERPTVKSALLKTIKLIPSEEKEGGIDAYVLSGYCSEEQNYSARRKWVRNAVGRGLEDLGSDQSPLKFIRVAKTHAFKDVERFRDIVELAIAQPELSGCRVLEGSSPKTGTAEYMASVYTDENDPVRSLYIFLRNIRKNKFIWAESQSLQSGETPDPSYITFRNKIRDAISVVSDYGKKPCFLWYLTHDSESSGDQVGTWSTQTVGQELARVLVEPSRPFLRSLGEAVFGRGNYAQLYKAAKKLQKKEKQALRAITFQLLRRTETERPALVVKYLDPHTGKIHWGYYDEPPGIQLPVKQEDDLREKIGNAIEELRKSPVLDGTEPLAVLIDSFPQNNRTKHLGRRPYEILVTSLTVRKQQPPIEWPYLLAKGIGAKGSNPKMAFNKQVLKELKNHKVASIMQVDLLPFHQPSQKHPDLPPKQLLLWETSLDDLRIERIASSPSLEESNRSIDTPSLPIKFIHEIIKTVMYGTQNKLKWEDLNSLKETWPAYEKVLRFALKDYPGNFTSHIVIQDIQGVKKIVSIGDSPDVARAWNGFAGFQSNLSRGKEEISPLVVLNRIEMKRGHPKTKTNSTGSYVGQLFPPDWWGQRPDGGSLLQFNDETIVRLLRRNLVYSMLKEGFSVTDANGLISHHQKKSKKKAATPFGEIDQELLREHRNVQGPHTAQVSVELTDLRVFPFEDQNQKLRLVYSVTIRPDGRFIHPPTAFRGLKETRFFAICDPTDSTGEGSVQDMMTRQLTQAGNKDIKALRSLRSLWKKDKLEEARKRCEQALKDLARWSKEYSSLSDTVKALAKELVLDAIEYETQNILAIRKTLSLEKLMNKERSNKVIDSTRSESRHLISNLKRWSKIHPFINELISSSVLRIAVGVSEIDRTLIVSILENQAIERAAGLDWTVTEWKFEAARFLGNELIKDLDAWASQNKSIRDKTRNNIIQIASTFLLHTTKIVEGAPDSVLSSDWEKNLLELEGLRTFSNKWIRDLNNWSKLDGAIRNTVKEPVEKLSSTWLKAMTQLIWKASPSPVVKNMDSNPNPSSLQKNYQKLESLMKFSTDLISDLQGWKGFDGVAQKIVDKELFQIASALTKVASRRLNKLGIESKTYDMDEIGNELTAIGSFCNALMGNLKKWAASDKRVKPLISQIALAIADANLLRTRRLFPQMYITYRKKSEKYKKFLAFKALLKSNNQCMDYLEQWANRFPSLQSVYFKSAKKTPKWRCNRWKDIKKVVKYQPTLQDAIDCLKKEIKSMQ